MNSFVKQGKNESVFFLHVAGLVLIIKQYVELRHLCEGFQGPNSTPSYEFGRIFINPYTSGLAGHQLQRTM